MGDSKIEWTEKTWNPVTGCSKVSQGCKNCYAERIFQRPYPGRAFTDVRTHEDRLDAPLHWRKPSRVFVNSMSDLFHEKVPDQFITDVFGIMALAHWHTFQILTKRPERMLRYLSAGDHGIIEQFRRIQEGGGMGQHSMFVALDRKRRDKVAWQWPLPNVWLGVSVEDQPTADERIPLLLQTPAAVRWVSYEPALGPVDFRKFLIVGPEGGFEYAYSRRQMLDWIVCGGESGHSARPMHPDWARSVRDQCQAAGIAFFMKQGSKANWLDYKNFDSFPQDLRVREYPSSPCIDSTDHLKERGE